MENLKEAHDNVNHILRSPQKEGAHFSEQTRKTGLCHSMELLCCINGTLNSDSRFVQACVRI
jgi:hypothetical protein